MHFTQLMKPSITPLKSKKRSEQKKKKNITSRMNAVKTDLMEMAANKRARRRNAGCRGFSASQSNTAPPLV